ncbi:DUF2721 domain-containing protein [uncultured Erythrobacter sp.]|uniref:DUF2721 domain-containing protein n=1 Tax=uncultured Erythrobacter sp. TaxID=263913 RepID=UPI0026200EB4|nr:DUF2721 domain-containing protein [uncultured Erythrobacter sp.]
MIFDLLSSGVASELLERTADTPRVLRAVELSLAPAFLLVGIGSIMNVMMARIIWVAGRIERLAESDNISCDVAHASEIEWLRKRRRLVRVAIKFSTAAAVVISLVIALLFVSAYIETRIGTIVAVLWVATVALLITGLVYFLRETLLAADGPKNDLYP